MSCRTHPASTTNCILRHSFPPYPGRLREARLRELRTAADARSEAQRAGHGTLGDVPEAGLLRAAQQAAPAPFVAHLALDGSPLDDDLDEHLTTLAARYLGTRFVRSRIALHSTLHLRLRTPPGPGGAGRACRSTTPPACPCCSPAKRMSVM